MRQVAFVVAWAVASSLVTVLHIRQHKSLVEGAMLAVATVAAGFAILITIWP